MPDPYQVLQVSRAAEPEVIEAAYRRLARKYHPDVNPSQQANSVMKELNWAYEILSDPVQRSRYDRSHPPTARPSSGSYYSPPRGPQSYSPPPRGPSPPFQATPPPPRPPFVRRFWPWIALAIATIYLVSRSKPPSVSELPGTTKQLVVAYAGPSVRYPSMGTIPQDSRVTIDGKTGDSWLTAHISGRRVWLQRFLINVDGNANGLPEVPAPYPEPGAPDSYADQPTRQQSTTPPVSQSKLEDDILSALELIVTDPRYDSSQSVLRDYLPYIDISVNSNVLKYTVLADMETADDFVSLAFDLILFSAVVVNQSEILGTPLARVEVVNPGPLESSATLSVAGQSTIEGIADGSIDIVDVMQSDVDWGQAPPSLAPAFPSCSDAASHVGQRLTCRMQRPYCSYRPDVNGNPTFCNDAPYPGHHFTLLVWGQDWSRFDGVCIDITGFVSRYEGKPEIVADDVSQVTTCQ